MDFDPITQLLLAGIAIIAAGFFILIGRERFELAVIGVALSPFLAAVFAIHSAEGELSHSETIGSYVRIGLLLLMGCVGVVKFWQHQAAQPQKIPLPMKLLMAFLVFALISTSYSIDWFYTLVRSISFIALFMFLIGLYVWLESDHRFNRIFHVLYYVFLIVVLANVASLFLLRESVWWIKNPNRFSGLWGHPNTMGAFCMICYPVALWKLAYIKSWHKLWVVLFLIVTASLHVITGSRSSILAGLLGVVVWFFFMKQRIKPIVLSVVIVGLGMLLVESTPIEQSFQRTVHQERSMTTLTGRSEFWIESLELLKEKPWFGYGFATAGKILAESELHNPEIRLWSGSAKTSLHNGYLTIASGVGIFGLMLWFMVLVMPLWRLRQFRSISEQAVIAAIVISCLVLNFVEDAINAGTSVPALSFWMAWTIALRRGNYDVANSLSAQKNEPTRLDKSKFDILNTSACMN